MEISFPGNEQQKKLIKVLEDLEPYKDNVVLIGGWLPYMYVNYVWKLEEDTFIIETIDIDFALREKHEKSSPLILDKLIKSGDYMTEPVYEDEPEPFNILVTYGVKNKNTMRIDFMSHEYCNPADFHKTLLGNGVNIIPLETVDFMLKKSNWIEITIPTEKADVRCNILKPSAYIFIKGISFAHRSLHEGNYKYLKDMWSIYFVLNNNPLAEKEKFFQEFKDYQKEEKLYSELFKDNIREYFTGVDAKGVKDLTGFLKSKFPEIEIKKRIEKKFKDLSDFLESNMKKESDSER